MVNDILQSHVYLHHEDIKTPIAYACYNMKPFAIQIVYLQQIINFVVPCIL